MKTQICISLVVFVLFSPFVSASPFYVATNGNDNSPGTEGMPWRTIQKAADTLTAGQIVYVKAGTYNEQVTIQNSGYAGQYITFLAYPNNIVTIDGSSISFGAWDDGLIKINGKHHIKFSGFRVINSQYMGFTILNSNDIIIEKNYITGSYASAILAGDGRNIVIDGNEITKAHIKSQESGYPHETVSLVNIDGFEVRNNKIYDSGMENIDLKGGSKNGKVHHNDIRGHTSAGIYLDGRGESNNIEIYSNRVHDTSLSSARGIVIGNEIAEGSVRNIKVYNNLIYNNAAIGFDVYWKSHGVIDNIQFVNNVVYNNGLVDSWGGGIFVDYVGATNVIIRNNIVYNNRNYNIKNNPKDTVFSNNLEQNPSFMNPFAGDFHLNAGSVGIDKGTAVNAPPIDFDGKSRPQGMGYDIGAFEYVTNIVTPTITPIVTPIITPPPSVSPKPTTTIPVIAKPPLNLFSYIQTELNKYVSSLSYTPPYNPPIQNNWFKSWVDNMFKLNRITQ